MRIHPTDPRLYLVELSDFRASPPPPQVQENAEALRTVVHWATDYLCNPHPELGRTGAVCPFTRPSLRRNVFFLTVVRGSELDADMVEGIVRAYRDWFLEMPPTDPRQAQYKTVNILFPDIPEEGWRTVIEATQDRLKSEFVPHGIMVGEFHPGPPEKAALWNPEFRPLKCPIPMLVIRHMVPTDFVFLRDRQDFLSAYLRLQGDRVPPIIAQDVRETAARFGLALPGAPAALPPEAEEVLAVAAGVCPAHVAAGHDAGEAACPVHLIDEPALTPTGA